MTFLTSYGATVRRTCVLSAAALTLVVTFGLVPEALAATASECEEAWTNGSSNAPDECNLTSTTASGNNCTVNASCQQVTQTDTQDPGTIEWVATSITVDLSDVGDLFNCNGTLTVGDCF